MPTVRCHDCGQTFPEKITVRRQVAVGGLDGFHTPVGGGGSPVYTGLTHYATVDLCPRCAYRRRERVRRFWRAAGRAGVVAAICLAFATALVVGVALAAALSSL